MITERPTSPQPLWFIDNLAYIHVDGAQSGGAYSVSETLAAAGNMPPLHVHHRSDETFYVLEGEVRLFVGGREILLARGQAALAPRDVPHSYRVESDCARWIVINAPAGHEEFLRAVSEAAPRAELPPAGRPVDHARLVEAAADQGIDILGPPGALPTHQSPRR
jgi:quercetin dioxygenase-like cupin family protein